MKKSIAYLSLLATTTMFHAQGHYMTNDKPLKIESYDLPHDIDELMRLYNLIIDKKASGSARYRDYVKNKVNKIVEKSKKLTFNEIGYVVYADESQ